MYAKALIETTNNKVNALPLGAIVQSDAKDYIFILSSETAKNHTFKMEPVQKGTEHDGYVEVILPAGVSQDSKIAVKGAYSLLSAMKNVEEE